MIHQLNRIRLTIVHIFLQMSFGPMGRANHGKGELYFGRQFMRLLDNQPHCVLPSMQACKRGAML